MTPAFYQFSQLLAFYDFPAGTLEPRELHAEDSLWDAWVITQQQLQTPPRKTDK